MEWHDEDDALLIDFLYRSRSLPMDEVDSCVDEFRISVRRGRSKPLRDILVRRGLLTRERIAEILAGERAGPRRGVGATARPPAAGLAADDEIGETARVAAPTPPQPIPVAARRRAAASWAWTIIGLVTLPAALGGVWVLANALKPPPRPPAPKVVEADPHPGATPEPPDETPGPDGAPGAREPSPTDPERERPTVPAPELVRDPAPEPAARPDPTAVGPDEEPGDGPGAQPAPADAGDEPGREAAERADLDPIARVLALAEKNPPEAPADRARRFEQLRRRGLVRYDEALERMKKAEQARRAQVKAEAESAINRSLRRPFRVVFAAGLPPTKARVVRYDEEGFTLQSVDSPTGNIERSYRWHEAPSDIALQVKRIALDRKSAADLAALGRFCLRRQLFSEAASAIEEARALDPRLPGLPDVEALRRSAPFKGRCERVGGSLIELTYEFEKPEELADFEGARGGIDDSGNLVLGGRESFLLRLKNIVFEDKVVIEADLSRGGTMRGAAVVGVFFDVGERAAVQGYIAYYSAAAGKVTLARTLSEPGKPPVRDPLAEKTVGGNARRIRFVASDGRLDLSLDGDRIGRATVPSLARVTVVVGGIEQSGSGEGRVAFDRLEVRGKASREWIRKTFAEVDAIVARELDEDIRIAQEIAGARAARDPEWLGPLSAEDGFGLGTGDKEAIRLIRAGRDYLKRGRDGWIGAIAAFGDAVQRSPKLAAARYMRGLVARLLGEPLLAALDAAVASSLVPDFYEAKALLAEALADLGRPREALRFATDAVAMRPDSSWARTVIGRARFEDGDLPGALEAFDIAVALDPFDDHARTRRRNVRHVLQGPPWERRFEEKTERYVVRSNVSATRCRYYAQQLEAIRDYYVKLFGEAPGDRGRSVVLIFDSAEGYHSYAQLTTDDRVESTLGYYHPKFRQLLLYEDKDDLAGEDALRVLYHEGFHQFIHPHISDIPYWLNEGLAEYFAGTTVEGGKVTATGAVLEGRLAELRGGIARALPFERIMTESPEEFYSGYVSLKYAQAWAMIHFFMRGAGRRYRPTLVQYVNALRRGASNREAFDASFGKLDLKALQQQWLLYVERL